MKSWTQPTDEVIEKVLSSVKKEADRQYFFARLKNPLWIGPLRKRGYFSSPPNMQPLPDGGLQYPYWPELAYLVTIAPEATAEIIDIVLALPKTDNIRVYDDILGMALKLSGGESVKLLPKLVEYAELQTQFLAHRYPLLLRHWAAEGNIDEALTIAEKLIPFREDPRAREKRQLRQRDPNAFGTTLEPVPRFDQWEYQQILEQGVRPLSEKEPYKVTIILIAAVADMLRKSIHSGNLDKGEDEDYSEIWCRRLGKTTHTYLDCRESLVHELTYACEQVYSKEPQHTDTLDKLLRDQRWKIFKRLRQQLYASHPNEQTLQWVREFILDHSDYSRWEHHYEFQLMIRKACEHFGPRLLSVSERSAIFDAILSGPSKEDFRLWMGERYTEEAFKERQQYFHHKQLRPFAAVLTGKTQEYFNTLKNEVKAEVITDDSYSPYSGVTGGTVSYRSPKPVKDLERLTDEEILAFLNEWNKEYRDKDNWLVEVNISALAGAFQSLFKEKILANDKRFTFWMEQRGMIARPIYIAAMANAMQELVKNKHFSNLNQWIEFCAWILTHSDSKRVGGEPEPRDDSSEHPDWGSSRRAVVDFIDACVNKETDAPIAARDGLAKLLQQVCNQLDWRLDHDRPVFLNGDDPITEAINNTRSLALESVVNFGFWVRRHLIGDPVPEVKEILSKRTAEGSEFPFTRPEHALLGMEFGNLYVLNQDWASFQRSTIFPKENKPVWQDAFGSYLRFNPPAKATFHILHSDYEYALENLAVLTSAKGGRDFAGRLAEHLFTYYLWDVYPLTGKQSLLARFYDKTSTERMHWAHLFDHVGRSLSNSGRQLDKPLIDRAVAYFDWRLKIAEPLELQKFAFWLEAECLDPEWRLQSYAKILGLERGKDVGLFSEVRALSKLLPEHLSLVVECFAKITDALKQDSQIYISAGEATSILKSGLNAQDPSVRKNAERAREKLLGLGRFDFLDVS